jgi:hypothetical protein
MVKQMISIVCSKGKFMKKLAILMILFSNLAFAQDYADVTSRVVVRDHRFRAKVQEMVLPYLTSSEKVEGEFFKVVKGKSREAIRFDDADRDLVLRASTTYYHLNKARDYFVHELKASYVENLPQLVVRVELTNQFNELGHFANDNLTPQYNNALTIPAGKGMPGRGIEPWEMEIWFRPQKKVHINTLKIKGGAMGDWGTVLSAFRKQMHMSSLQRFVAQLAQAQLNPDTPMAQNFYSWESLVRVAGTSLLLEAVYQFSDPITRAVSRKWFWLDSALVPEIIYHEFAHVALSDHLVLSHSTAVIEGMADFFAGQIADSPNLATRIKKYNTFNGKKANRKQSYMVQFETTDYANSDFVFGMLWDLNSIIGQEPAPSFVYALREKINTNSTIKNQFIEGILETCEEKCELPFVDKLKILQRYNSRGI